MNDLLAMRSTHSDAMHLSADLSESAFWHASIITETDCACSPEKLFNYVTTPALWHKWHPATVSVSGVPNRPLTLGETMSESITAPLRRFDAMWTVEDCVPYERWVITTHTAVGASRITYRITPSSTGCHFQRMMQYRVHERTWRRHISGLARWLLKRQSQRALANLRRVAAGL